MIQAAGAWQPAPNGHLRVRSAAAAQYGIIAACSVIHQPIRHYMPEQFERVMSGGMDAACGLNGLP